MSAQNPSGSDFVSFQHGAGTKKKNRAFSSPVASSDRPAPGVAPDRKQAEDAVRTLIAWAGDNPDRDDLKNTPERIVRAYEEFFSGYDVDLSSFRWTLEDAGGYADMVFLSNIKFESFCQHHMLPILGVAHIAYFPDRHIAGLSKFGRIVDIFSKRLQNQERMTREIAEAIDGGLEARGVAVALAARHLCITSRGVHKPNIVTHTFHYTGTFVEQPYLCERFARMLPEAESGDI